jgi:hypothetical protein
MRALDSNRAERLPERTNAESFSRFSALIGKTHLDGDLFTGHESRASID